MLRPVRIGAALAVSIAIAPAVVPASAQAPAGGRVGPSLSITGNGRALKPLGRMTTVGDFPTGAALTPDGRFLWTVSAGHGRDDVEIVEVASGRVVQVVPLPGAYVGVAFAPDGLRAYVSGEPKGNSKPTGPTLADKGDAIHVFAVDPRSGHAAERAPIELPATSGGTAQSHAGAAIPGFPPPPGPTAGSALDWPQGLAVSPDGALLVVALNQADRAAIVDLATGSVRLVPTGAYPYGVAISRDSRSAFVTNEYDGSLTDIDLPSGSVRATIPLGVPGGDRNSHPEGIVSDPTRDRVYVAVTNRDQVATLDTDTRRVLGFVSVANPEGVGASPVALGVSPDGSTLYSADAGEDAIAAISIAQRPASPPRPRRVVRVRSLADARRYRALRARLVRRAGHGRAATRRLRRADAALRRRWLTGGIALACGGPSRAQESAYMRALQRALDRNARLLRRARGRRVARRRAAFALARDVAAAGRRLPPLVRCRGGQLWGLPAGQLIGKLAAAAYPSGVAVTPDGARLVWLAAKGLGAGPNPGYGTPFAHSEAAPYGNYVPDMLLGRVGVLDQPTDVMARAATDATRAVLRPVGATDPPPGTPLRPDGPIKHVFYVVRENRTYDQIFGSDPRGDGDPSLQVFDDNGVPGPAGGVTPNAHALSRTFPLLDHFYANSEVSVDGHLITAGGFATDFVQKALQANYADRGRVDEFGTYPVTLPPNYFIFDQAVRQSVSFRNYGEFSAGVLPTANDGRPTFAPVGASTMYSYPLFFGCDGLPVAPNGVNNRAICDTDSGTLGPLGNSNVTHSRFNYFQQQFNAELMAGQVPAFNYLTLPNDHTNGVHANYPTPRALVADNDLALGQLVDLISHSPIWHDSAIFVVEDDSQDGADHVDAHRMPAFVISPWARHGVAVHTRYDQASALRSAELLLGLQPLSLFDATAAPMYDAFSPVADDTPYSAITPQQSLTETTSPQQAQAAGPLARSLPYAIRDLVPQRLFDQVIWRSVYGAGSTPPPPGPDSSPIEAGRATGTLRAFRRGVPPARYLERAAAGDG